MREKLIPVAQPTAPVAQPTAPVAPAATPVVTAVETFVAGVIGLASILGTWNAAAEPVVRVYAETAAATGSLADINLVQAIADLRYPVRRYCELCGIPGVDIHPMRPGQLDRRENDWICADECVRSLDIHDPRDIDVIRGSLHGALVRNPGETSIDRIIVDSGVLRLIGVELAGGRPLPPELEEEPTF